MNLVVKLSTIINKKKHIKTLDELSSADKKKLFKRAAMKANELQYELMNS